MVAPAFLLALIIRSTSLLLPQTFFQPDEFYQALEPAHQLVFGYGYLTWEWKDLPEIGSSGISTYITAGRMRSWIWPGVFALVYKGLKTLRLDDTFLIVRRLPRDVSHPADIRQVCLGLLGSWWQPRLTMLLFD